MAQSGFTPILIYASGTTGNSPSAANLTSSSQGAELALNYFDGKLFYKDASGNVQVLATKGTGPIGGSNTQIQYNSSGALAGSANLTFDGTNLGIGGSPVSSKGQLQVGTIGYTDTGVLAGFASSVAGYNQVILQNTNSGSTASTNFNVSNDQGSATTNYGEFGINSSGFSGSGFSTAGWTYLASASTDLAIGTYGSNAIHFIVNSGTTDAMTISSAGAVSLPGGTANGVAYLNGSKVLTTGSALTFDGSKLLVSSSGEQVKLLSSGDFTTTGTGYIRWYDSGGAKGYIGYAGTANEFDLQTGPGMNLNFNAVGGTTTFAVSNAEQMRLTSTGLGIGTSSPATALDITSANTNVANFNGTGTNGTAIRLQNSGTNTFLIGSSKYLTGGSASEYGIGTLGATPIIFVTNGSERARIDSSGNLGLGVTPSAWESGAKVLQLSTATAGGTANDSCAIWARADSMRLINGAYYNGTSYVYTSTGVAPSIFSVGNTPGGFVWQSAPSGTAGGNPSFTTTMTLDASGNLLVGGTTASISSGTGIKLLNDTANHISSVSSYTTSGQGESFVAYSTGASAFRFYVDWAGTIHATSIVITAISDERLKENIRDLDTGLSTVMALKPRRYDWKEGKGLDKKNAAGFIAQEFETVFPDSVGTSKAGADGIEYKNINYEELIPTLVKAIQEQQSIITDLQAKLKSAGVAGF